MASNAKPPKWTATQAVSFHTELAALWKWMNDDLINELNQKEQSDLKEWATCIANLKTLKEARFDKLISFTNMTVGTTKHVLHQDEWSNLASSLRVFYILLQYRLSYENLKVNHASSPALTARAPTHSPKPSLSVFIGEELESNTFLAFGGFSNGTRNELRQYGIEDEKELGQSISLLHGSQTAHQLFTSNQPLTLNYIRDLRQKFFDRIEKCLPVRLESV